jgi:hypothetical protein
MPFVFVGCSDKGLSFIVLYIIIFLVSVISGSGSAGRRKILVLHLIRSCREMEMKFLVRTLVSHQLLPCSLQFLFWCCIAWNHCRMQIVHGFCGFDLILILIAYIYLSQSEVFEYCFTVYNFHAFTIFWNSTVFRYGEGWSLTLFCILLLYSSDMLLCLLS